MGEIFVIGSGASLNRITEDEAYYVNGAEAVISFNMYLIFWKRVGIVPTHHIMLDYVHNRFVYEMVFDTCRKNGFWRTRFLLHRYWEGRIYTDPAVFYWRKVKRALRGRGPTDMVVVDSRLEIGYLDIGPWDRLEYLWGRGLDERLFHFRGTLTTAINVAHVLDPHATIKLLGVDLNTPDYFFQDQMPRLIRLKRKEGSSDLDWEYNLRAGRHGTVLPYGELPPMTAAFPFIRQQVEATGGRIFCCNKESLLVEEGHLSYGPVIGD
ncbi:MAG: hypothetical protein JRH07_16075 [Deltaproteobacteria bacterium]|nr:hypothetical protein [Deltaproteobacteria bacterium]MBW2123341.1 hypothetical protein [Deltaproteobacteria bacterium]